MLDRKTKRILLVLLGTLFIAITVVGLSYIHNQGVKKGVLVCIQDIPEGTLITEDNFPFYFGKLLIPVTTATELKLFDYSGEVNSNFYNKRMKYLRKKGDLINSYDIVKIDMEKDLIKYKLALLSEKFGKKYVAKSIKLNPDEYFQAKGISKGEDNVKIKFIKEYEKEQMLIDRYKRVPILDWDMKNKNITNIIVALPEKEASMFDLERLSSKKMIVEFEPFLAENYKSSDKTIFWQKEIDEQYKKGIQIDIKPEGTILEKTIKTGGS